MKWSDYRNKILAEIDNEAYLRSILKGIVSRGTEWKCICPNAAQHEGGVDANPSCAVNVSKGIFHCNTCGLKGNIHTLHKLQTGKTGDEAWFDLGDELGIQRPDSSKPARPEIEPGIVAEYHSTLMKLTGPIREVLRVKRGLTDATLKRFQLGWDGERITIPIYDEYNALVNIRRYQWNSNEDQFKVINYQDEFGNSYGEVRIYGIDNLVNDSVKEIVWCEGELDRIIAEQHGFTACCPTSGAGTWQSEWRKYFTDKDKVILCQDNDEAGFRATAKLGDRLNATVATYTIKWPEEFPAKGDITDFFTVCKQNAQDFRRLLNDAPKFLSDDSVDKEDDMDASTPEVSLSLSSHAKYHGKRVKIPIMLSGRAEQPYKIPWKVEFDCGTFCNPESKTCATCDLAKVGGNNMLQIKASDKVLLNLIECSDEAQEKALKAAAGIKTTCPRVEMTTHKSMHLTEIRMIPKADNDSGAAVTHDYTVRTGYVLANSIRANCRYTIAGYVVSHPKTQTVTYVFDKAYPEKSLFTSFDMTDEILENLKKLQVQPGETVAGKIDTIHKDLERNVTKVWERTDVAKAVDLIYHSCRTFMFQESFINRGWAELLIIGDSGQAKSTLVNRLMDHYSVGEKINGEAAKRTGLLYNMQSDRGRWFITWGAIPINDGGLITIDELSGVETNDIGQLSDVRTAGKAKVTGVATSETNARTRIIFMGNPRNGKGLKTETYGVEAALKLMGKTEDVRRLDMVMAVASGDVDPALINRPIATMPTVDHVITTDVRKHSVLWAWSRKTDDVIFEPEATQHILEQATEMGKKYCSSIPIVEPADQRIKLARLAVACAASLFSTDETYTKVVVTKEHVEYIVDFLTKIYAAPALGYDRYSRDKLLVSDDSEANVQVIREAFATLQVPDVNDLAEALYRLPYFNRNTLEDYTGLAREDISVLFRFLTKYALIDRARDGYRRMPLGTTLLTDIKARPITAEELKEAKRKLYNNEY